MKYMHGTSIGEQGGTFGVTQYSELMELIRDLIFTLSPEGSVIELNKVFETYTGWKISDWIGKQFINLIHPGDTDLVLLRFSNLKKGILTGSIEVRILKKSGDYIFCDILVSPKFEEGKIIKIVGIARDITQNVIDRKLAAKALSESEQKFKSAFMISSDAMYIATLDDGLLIEINSAYIELFGYSREEATGKTALQLGLFHKPEDRLKLVNEIRKNSTVRDYELTGCRKDGKLILVSISVNILEFDGRKFQLGVLKDITDAKSKEVALRESESKYRKLHESITDAFASVSMDGRLMEWNKSYENMLGYPREELCKLTYSDLTPSRWWKFEKSLVAKLLKKGYSGVYEKEYRRKDGTVFPIEIRAFLIRDDKGNPTRMWGMVRDISERKRTESELFHAKEIAEKSQAILVSLNQHMREVREHERAVISREIHDQLGQSLTALKIDIDWLYNRATPGSLPKMKLKRMIELVTTTIEDVQRISSELRPSILDDIGLSAAMEWYCEDFSNRTGLPVIMEFENIGFDNMNTNLAFYRILQESLTNIIRHACARTAEVKFFKTKNRITLMVQDDGIGISPDKIKSPKSLGLVGMFERIKNEGGNMKISKSSSGGTKISVNIPLTKEKT